MEMYWLFYFDCQEFHFCFFSGLLYCYHAFSDQRSMVYLLQYIEETKMMSQNQMFHISMLCALRCLECSLFMLTASQSKPSMFDLQESFLAVASTKSLQDCWRWRGREEFIGEHLWSRSVSDRFRRALTLQLMTQATASHVSKAHPACRGSAERTVGFCSLSVSLAALSLIPLPLLNRELSVILKHQACLTRPT